MKKPYYTDGKEKIIKILEPYFLQWQFQEHPDNLGRKMTEIATQILELFAQEKEKDRQKFIDALIWCSGSDDFQVGGKARKGWEKICLPLLKKDERN